MKRREFVKRTSQALALAGVAAGTGVGFHNRERSAYEPARALRTNFTVAVDKALPGITMAVDEDPAVALRQALDAIGGIKRFVAKGEKVTIKPNVGWDRSPAQAANTNPLLVGEMARLCMAAGAREVIVSDVTCNDARRCFLRSGIREAAEKFGARVELATAEDYLTADLGGQLLTSWPVLKHFVETDRLINMPIVKHHSLTDCTIGMKNLYGIIGGRRNQLHQQIDQSIVDLASFARPTLTVVDATRVLLRGGPQGGSLNDVTHPNSVICATDQVAADTRGVEFLGRRGEEISHILLAEKAGLGRIDYRNLGYREIAG